MLNGILSLVMYLALLGVGQCEIELCFSEQSIGQTHICL